MSEGRAVEADPPVAAAAPTPPLPLRVKIAYGAPSFAGAAMAIPIVIHLTIFYSDEILVPLGFIALVKAFARAFDAFTDPLMGWVTDRTHTRWGRRRPWLAIGSPLAAIAFVAMFAPPEVLSVHQAAVWFALTYTLYYLFHTIYEIPHGGLGPELTLDYQERNSLFSWRVPFLVGGTLVASALPPLLISSLGTRTAYFTFAIVFGVVLVLLYANLIFQVRERPDFVYRAPNPLVPGLRRVMRNRAFRVLLFVYLTGSITGAIPGLMMPYFTRYVLRPDNWEKWLGIFLAIYFASGFLSLPIWVMLARRLGKLQAWLISFIPGLTGSLLIFFMLGEGDLLLTAIVLVWAGSAFSAGIFLGPSMQADVIDYDELYTGKRREAQYNGLWSIMTKFTVIPSMSIPLAVLAAYGYVPNVPQSDTVVFVIRAIFGLAPATTSILALLIATRYPITQRVHERIWEGIEAHKRGELAIDPLTERLVPPPLERGVDEDTGWFLDHFSTGELRRYLDRGARQVLASSVVAVLACAALCAAGAWNTMRLGSDFETEPGVWAVLSVLVAGISFAGFCFHVMRVRAALHLARAPVASEQVEAHLAFTQLVTRGEIPVQPELPAARESVRL